MNAQKDNHSQQESGRLASVEETKLSGVACNSADTILNMNQSATNREFIYFLLGVIIGALIVSNIWMWGT